MTLWVRINIFKKGLGEKIFYHHIKANNPEKLIIKSSELLFGQVRHYLHNHMMTDADSLPEVGTKSDGLEKV